MTPAELIAALEAAEEPSRELDAEIWRHASFPDGYHVVVLSQNDGSIGTGKHKHEAIARTIAWLKARMT